VPPGDGWTRAPYDARWVDGRLVGRGANDAKASAAAMLLALAAQARRGGGPGAVLALNACEETTNAGMAAVLAHLGRPEAAVVGEPTGLDVVRSQGGLVVLEAVWTGKSCHAAHAARTEHVNALSLAATALARFGPFRTLPVEDALLGPTTVVPTLLESGSRHNIVPDRARAVFDCRTSPPHDAETCAALLRAELPGAEVTVRSARLRAVSPPAEHPLVQRALALAGRTAASGSNTLSDMALLQGVPAIKCGPGQSLRSHKPDEFVTADELARGAAFYDALLEAWLAQPAAMTP
jgi:acetylornithine deacetylase